jgi:uncharacterized ferritin-like protein (DUF455 family)
MHATLRRYGYAGFHALKSLRTHRPISCRAASCRAASGSPALLDPWRASDDGRDGLVWSPKEGPVSLSSCDTVERDVYEALRGAETDVEGISCASLEEYGRLVLNSAHPLLKAELTHKAWNEYRSGNVSILAAAVDGDSRPRPVPESPARPEAPALVPAREIPLLKQSSLSPSAYTLHNLAHVELNAIDLAWDTVCRFAHLRLPDDFYLDFARVADDESRHLGWCLQRMSELGTHYGDMPAHNLLWEGCIASASDVRERLAVVPMSQEARGLDAGGRLAERLVGWGDSVSAAIVSRISDEEKQHVAVGVYWFSRICESLEIDGRRAFVDTLTRLTPDLLRPPFNDAGRQAVGLPREYYDETLWDDSDKRRIDSIRRERKAANPRGSGVIDARMDPSDALPPFDAAELRVRLEAFLNFEDDVAV